MSDENTLEFIIKMRDEATETLKNITGELAEHVDTHTGLAAASGASGAALNTVADAALVAAKGNGTAAAAAGMHAGSLEDITANAAATEAAIKGVSEATVEAEGHSRSFIATLLATESAADGWRMLQGVLGGVSEKAASLRADTVEYMNAALKDVPGGAAALERLSASIGQVNTQGDALRVTREALAGLTGTAPSMEALGKAALDVSAANNALKASREALGTLTAGGATAAEVGVAMADVQAKSQDYSKAQIGLAALNSANPILDGLKTRLSEVSGKTEEATGLMRGFALIAEKAGESFREFSAEAGFAGEVLKAFGPEGLLAGLGIAAVTAALGEGIKAFAEYQEMASRTSRFAELAGRSGGFEAVHATSLDIAENSTFSSSQLDEAGAAISRFTNLSSAEVSQVMQLSADTAAATGQDISSVAQMLGRAFNEPLKGAMLLNRYTRNIDPGTMAELKQMDAAGNVSGERSLLADKVNAFAGGQAEEQTKTLAGAFSILGDGIEESFGKGLEMVGALVDAFTPLQAVIEGTGRLLEKVGDGFDNVTQHVLDMAGSNGPEAKDAAQLNTLLSRDNPNGSLGDASSAHFYAQQDAAKIAELESELKALDPQGAVNAQGQFAPSGVVPVGNLNSSTGLYPQQDNLVATQVQEADKLLPEQSKNALLSDSQTGMTGAVKILEDANKYLESFGPPAKEAAATIATNTENIKLFKDALGVLGTQIADTTSAVSDMVSKLANEAYSAGLVGGDKDVQTFAMQLAPAYLKDHPEFAASPSEKGRNTDQLTADAAALPDVQTEAIQHQTDMVIAKRSATDFENNAENPYLAGEKSKDPHTAELFTAMHDAVKAGIADGGKDFVSDVVVNQKTGAATLKPGASQLARDGYATYEDTFKQSLTSASASNPDPQSGADKKFSSITDVTQSATAYNELLKSGNVTLGQAKEYQDAYTEAQQASADKSISFQAALKQTIALINERNKVTAESTQLEADLTNKQDAAVNQALFSGGTKASDLVAAQNKAANAGLKPGSDAYTASVNSDLVANTNAANKTVGSSYNELLNQQKLLSAPQNPNSQADMQFALANPDASPADLAQYDQMADKVREETAAVNAAKEAHAAWTNVAAQGFQSMDSALVDVIMRTKTWGQAFGDVAKQMASQIANLIIQQELLTPLEQMMGLAPGGGAGGSTSGSGGFGGLLGAVGGASGIIGDIAGLFGGGGSAAQQVLAGGMGSPSGAVNTLAGSVGSSVLSAAAPEATSLVSKAGSWLSSFFADGGVSGDGVQGSIPLKMYAAGGVAANGPQVSVFGEAGPEAYVPLADGRSIPVTVSHTGGAGASAPAAGNMTNHFNVSVNTGAAPSGATPAAHAAMVGAEVSRQLESMVVKVIQNQQRSGGILS